MHIMNRDLEVHFKEEIAILDGHKYKGKTG